MRNPNSGALAFTVPAVITSAWHLRRFE